MTKFKAVAFITASLIISNIVSTPANASIKAGTKCSVVGQVKSGLTCTKISNKKIWQKKAVQSAIAVPLTLDNLDPKRVPSAAYDSVVTALKMRSRAKIVPTYYLSPNVNKARADEETLGLNRAIDLFAPYFSPEKFQIVYMTGLDADWMDAKSSELGIQSLLPPGSTFGQHINSSQVCNFGMAGVSQSGIPTYVRCLSAAFSGGEKQGAPHEYVHLFQRNYNATRNVWYAEGSGSFFGWTLGFYPYNPNSSIRSSWLGSLFWNMPAEAKYEFASRDMTRFKTQMHQIGDTQNSQQLATIGYWVGGLATEALVAVYGFDKFVEFSMAMQSGGSISSTLDKVYGLDEDSFYEKLAPYVWANMKGF